MGSVGEGALLHQEGSCGVSADKPKKSVSFRYTIEVPTGREAVCSPKAEATKRSSTASISTDNKSRRARDGGHPVSCFPANSRAPSPVAWRTTKKKEKSKEKIFFFFFPKRHFFSSLLSHHGDSFEKL
jgi:hypothetical protein